jgi:hypothetical protein
VWHRTTKDKLLVKAGRSYLDRYTDIEAATNPLILCIDNTGVSTAEPQVVLNCLDAYQYLLGNERSAAVETVEIRERSKFSKPVLSPTMICRGGLPRRGGLPTLASAESSCKVWFGRLERDSPESHRRHRWSESHQLISMVPGLLPINGAPHLDTTESLSQDRHVVLCSSS